MKNDLKISEVFMEVAFKCTMAIFMLCGIFGQKVYRNFKNLFKKIFKNGKISLIKYVSVGFCTEKSPFTVYTCFDSTKTLNFGISLSEALFSVPYIEFGYCGEYNISNEEKSFSKGLFTEIGFSKDFTFFSLFFAIGFM